MTDSAISRKRDSYHLELAQRDFFGIIDEPMDFSEASIAKTIVEIAQDDVGKGTAGYSYLAAVIRALTGHDHEWKLVLVKRTRGRFHSVSDHAEIFDRQRWITRFVEYQVSIGVKKEAAVQMAMDETKCSRQTVFSAIKAMKRREEIGRMLDNLPKRIKPLSEMT